MRKALLNYTTEIDAAVTLGEIQALLAGSGVSAIMTCYDKDRNPTGVSFRIETSQGFIGFNLPANAGPVLLVINKQVVQKRIPKRFMNDKAQATRVAWRIVKVWLEAQLAFVETGMVAMQEVFLPYAQNPETGVTVYERFKEGQFKGLCLPPAK